MASHEKQLQIRAYQLLAEKSGYAWTAPVDLPGEWLKDANLPQTDAKLYNKEFGLYPPDLFAYLKQTQAAEYAKVFPASLDAAALESRQQQLLKTVAKRLDKPFKDGGGLINALTKQFMFTIGGKTARFKLAQLPPDSTQNVVVMDQYAGNIMRVIHEVSYSLHKRDTIDAIITINGLPVVTLEMKNGDSQDWREAVEQYRKDRTPWAVDQANRRQGNRREPLLAGKRAVVHFAVDPSHVQMSTELNGATTHFMPFEPGEQYREAIVNSLTTEQDEAHATDFLWLDLLHRENILALLKNFVTQSTVENLNPETGQISYREETLFPRYHQWFGVSLAIAVTLREGVGKSSLMQWSAGSGKSFGISWLAHTLSSLQYDDPIYQLTALSPSLRTAVLQKAPKQLHEHPTGSVFSGGGFIITDRLNLDEQLTKDVNKRQRPDGFITHIKRAKGGMSGSKAQQLKAELRKAGSGLKIITIQSFPRALVAIREMAATGEMPTGRDYFVIRDEAHTSEGGKNANAVSASLNFPELAAEISVLEQRRAKGEISVTEFVDELMLLEQQTKSDHAHISYFAFTATPKKETLERFGRENQQHEAEALHTYTMAEAIEEGYILDVLRNYTTYEVASELAVSTAAGSRQVESDAGKKHINAWLRGHPDTIAAKAEIIVDHFFANGFNKLENNAAQAMVFTDSRENALTYQQMLDAAIRRKGLNFHTVVAFSGELETVDLETGELITVTERSVNATTKPIDVLFEQGKDKKTSYQFLVVADKYQTGYDNPRLVCGYVDKKIKDAAAVQLLSRMNRTAHSLGKQEVHILDFANDFDDIQAAFGQYRSTLTLADKTDPNKLHELQQRINTYPYFDTDLMHAYAMASIQHDRVRMGNLLQKPKAAWHADLRQAQQRNSSVDIERLERLPGLLQKYVLTYGYQSTIISYDSSEIEQWAMLYSGLYTALSTLNRNSDDLGDTFDLDGLGIVSTRIRQKESTVSPYVEVEPLHISETEIGESMGPKNAEMVYLRDLVEYLNHLRGNNAGAHDQDFTTMIEHVVNSALRDPEFMTRARSNDLERLLESPKTQQTLEDILSTSYQSYASTITTIMGDDKALTTVSRLLTSMIWERATNGMIENT